LRLSQCINKGRKKTKKSAAKGNSTAETDERRQQQQLHENNLSTYLEVYFLRRILQIDRLLEDITLLGQLFALRPVVESACDEHFFGGMLPREKESPNVSSVFP
jgi:hypothetical protein